ncbi:MAG: DUF4173 domain-containing protein [Planctomycetes bacterium]|nr:DUF4173 domain-containing protein [Planctomycetota bacterium]
MNPTSPPAGKAILPVQIKTVKVEEPLFQSLADKLRQHASKHFTGWRTLSALLMVIFMDICLYNSMGGFGLALLTSLCLLLLLINHNFRLRKDCLFSLVVLTALISRSVWQFHWALIPLCLISLFSFQLSLQGEAFRVPERLCSFFITLTQRLLTLLSYPFALSNYLMPSPSLRKKLTSPSAWQTLLIPFGIGAIFIWIFCQANPIVAQIIENLGDDLDHHYNDIEIYLPDSNRLITWAFFCWLSLIILLPTATICGRLNRLFGPSEELEEELSPSKTNEQNARNAMGVLITLNLIFFLYNLVDIYYLWAKGELPSGIPLVTYAHEGVFWLATALVMTTVVLCTIFAKELNFHPQTPWLKRLAGIWAFQNAILALSAFQRLHLYIDYNGLTLMRIVGITGISIVVIALVLVIMKVFKRHSSLWLLRRQSAVVVLALYLLMLSPLDFWVALFNTHRILSGNERSAVQLLAQSYSTEAVPALIPLLQSQNRIIKEGAGVLLYRKQKELLAQKEENESHWLNGELSGTKALKALEGVAGQLEQYAETSKQEKILNRTRRFTRKHY